MLPYPCPGIILEAMSRNDDEVLSGTLVTTVMTDLDDLIRSEFGECDSTALPRQSALPSVQGALVDDGRVVEVMSEVISAVMVKIKCGRDVDVEFATGVCVGLGLCCLRAIMTPGVMAAISKRISATAAVMYMYNLLRFSGAFGGSSTGS